MPSSSAFASPKVPPPLPSSLSARLHSTIDPLTGNCKHHPKVQLCQLVGVHDNTRWVIRRKVCIKCGSRTPVGGYDKRVPGKAVTNPAQRNSRDSPAEVARIGRSRSNCRSKSRPLSSRSTPVDQVEVVRNGRVSDGGSGSNDDERFGRQRSPSRPRSGNESGDDERHGRRRSPSRPRSGNERGDDERHGRRRSASRPRSGNGSSDEERHRRRRSASRPRSGNGSGDDERHGQRRSASRPRHRRRDCDDVKGKTINIERMSSLHQLAIVPQGRSKKQ